MTKAHHDLPVGFEIEPATYDITREKIAVYSRYVFGGRDTKNIHTDDDTARRAGLPRAVAQGRYPIAYMSERALAFFGPGWVRGGRLDVKLVKPIYPGDTIRVRGTVKDKATDSGAMRIVLDMWLENQHGERVTVGTASGLVPPPADSPAGRLELTMLAREPAAVR